MTERHLNGVRGRPKAAIVVAVRFQIFCPHCHRPLPGPLKGNRFDEVDCNRCWKKLRTSKETERFDEE